MDYYVQKNKKKKRHRRSKNTHSDKLGHENLLALDLTHQFRMQSPSSLHKSKNVRSRPHQLSLPNEDGINGFVLNGHRLPQDHIEDILILLDPDTLKMTRFVCKTWREMIENYVFKRKAMREAVYSFSECSEKEKSELSLPWWLYYTICKFDPFNRNLLQNNCGQDGMNHWIVAPGGFGLRYSGWAQESPPRGCDPLPDSPDFEGCTSCFTTSLGSCDKEQVIRFSEVGLFDKIMDEYRPKIIVSEWCASDSQRMYYYQFDSYLQDNEQRIISEVNAEKLSPLYKGHKWHKVERILKEYRPGARTITFCDTGYDDTGYESDFDFHTKMSGAVVKVCLPTNQPVKQHRRRRRRRHRGTRRR